MVLSLVATVFSGTLGAQTADQIQPESGSDEYSTNFCAEKMLRQDLNFLTAPIKSESDLRRHLRDVRKSDIGSPFAYLSAESRKRFAESVKFNEKGVTSYRYDVLERELTPSQIYQVLAMLGQQHNIEMFKNARIESKLDREIMDAVDSNQPTTKCSSQDIPGYFCAARATCSPSKVMICMRTC